MGKVLYILHASTSALYPINFENHICFKLLGKFDICLLLNNNNIIKSGSFVDAPQYRKRPAPPPPPPEGTPKIFRNIYTHTCCVTCVSYHRFIFGFEARSKLYIGRIYLASKLVKNYILARYFLVVY